MKKEKTLLIVDDDARNIFALTATLRAKQYLVQSALSMHEAFSLLKSRHDFGVILLDMMMPEMDGYEALAILKQDEDLKNIPVVAVTAQAMAGDREKCLEAGADYYLSKPVDVDMLDNVLNAL